MPKKKRCYAIAVTQNPVEKCRGMRLSLSGKGQEGVKMSEEAEGYAEWLADDVREYVGDKIDFGMVVTTDMMIAYLEEQVDWLKENRWRLDGVKTRA
jgi:carboxypeptidase C (cathepsin A)